MQSQTTIVATHPSYLHYHLTPVPVADVQCRYTNDVSIVVTAVNGFARIAQSGPSRVHCTTPWKR